ncbi:hypothetical protein ACFPRL_00980 [Pseudoclavibacter helvolus]
MNEPSHASSSVVPPSAPRRTEGSCTSAATSLTAALTCPYPRSTAVGAKSDIARTMAPPRIRVVPNTPRRTFPTERRRRGLVAARAWAGGAGRVLVIDRGLLVVGRIRFSNSTLWAACEWMHRRCDLQRGGTQVCLG